MPQQSICIKDGNYVISLQSEPQNSFPTKIWLTEIHKPLFRWSIKKSCIEFAAYIAFNFKKRAFHCTIEYNDPRFMYQSCLFRN